MPSFLFTLLFTFCSIISNKARKFALFCFSLTNISFYIKTVNI
nr:MAG TPA: hypothetical protein [Caudoviricetes sp.]